MRSPRKHSSSPDRHTRQRRHDRDVVRHRRSSYSRSPSRGRRPSRRESLTSDRMR
jgi:hypothetical protein